MMMVTCCGMIVMGMKDKEKPQRSPLIFKTIQYLGTKYTVNHWPEMSNDSISQHLNQYLSPTHFIRSPKSVSAKAKIPNGRKRPHRIAIFNQLPHPGSLVYSDYSLQAEPTLAEKIQWLSNDFFPREFWPERGLAITKPSLDLQMKKLGPSKLACPAHSRLLHEQMAPLALECRCTCSRLMGFRSHVPNCEAFN